MRANPQGLKPALILKAFGGAEAPLFPGITGIHGIARRHSGKQRESFAATLEAELSAGSGTRALAKTIYVMRGLLVSAPGGALSVVLSQLHLFCFQQVDTLRKGQVRGDAAKVAQHFVAYHVETFDQQYFPREA
jgi:hypothetical protein